MNKLLLFTICIAFLSNLRSHEVSFFKLEEPFSSLLKEYPYIQKYGGVAIKSDNDSLIVLVTVQTTNKNPMHRVITAREKASRELVNYFEGFEVDSYTLIKNTTESGDSSQHTIATNVNETLITEAKAAIKNLPVLSEFIDNHGVYNCAYGGVFSNNR
jgi:hypothetical protein